MRFHYADLSDSPPFRRALDHVLPDEVHNLAAQSHVAVSFEAGSSEIRLHALPQSEATFHPRSPHAVAAVAAHWYTVNHREAYGPFACNGVLFNHESPRRGENFVTRKITAPSVASRSGSRPLSSRQPLRRQGLGLRWGLRVPHREEFLQAAFGHAGLNWKDHVVIDKKYFRPSEVDCLRRSIQVEESALVKPKVGFQHLVEMMVDNDIELAMKEKVLVDAGYRDT
ncbi:hypothetical protein ZWY2020_011338 [Hordeum vulgare]|nr:hypothetical protein ZWY2020_011338 [Hordeum vulgare]